MSKHTDRCVHIHISGPFWRLSVRMKIKLRGPLTSHRLREQMPPDRSPCPVEHREAWCLVCLPCRLCHSLAWEVLLRETTMDPMQAMQRNTWGLWMDQDPCWCF